MRADSGGRLAVAYAVHRADFEGVLAVDTQGLPHAIHVTTADVTDRAGALRPVTVTDCAVPAGVQFVLDGTDVPASWRYS